MDEIAIKGARVNNLKNVDVTIPRGKLVVVTGLSGSGKSSLAFDTLYAEGQRRYVESLSSYARQFLSRMAKPEADKIVGLPPAIAIEQKVSTRNSRSTVGTSTEIYHYLRLLFARVGKTVSPVSGTVVKKHTVDDLVSAALEYPAGTRIAVAAPISLPDKRPWVKQIDVYKREGFARLVNPATGEMLTLDEAREQVATPREWLLLIDRLAVPEGEGDEMSRLRDSAETAFFEGREQAVLLAWPQKGAPVRADFSKRFEADGISFIEPSEALFNFNNPYGACPNCEGFGSALGIDENLVILDPNRSVYEDTVLPWHGPKMSEWKTWFISCASQVGFPIHKPYNQLTDKERDFLWHGGEGTEFTGIDGFFRWVDENQYKIQYRVMKARYTGRTTCPQCQGRRLRPEAFYVKVAGMDISQLTRMPVDKLNAWFDALELEGNDAQIAERLLREIRNRLSFLTDVGLGYLTLDRASNTLSGGESQRINLATSLGSSLVGSMYILDEPSIGLHPRDTDRLISVIERLRDLGNTVVVVEHDEEIMRHADYIIDVGPQAGSNGGNIVFQGPPEKLAKAKNSYTADYLLKRLTIDVPAHRRKWRDSLKLQHISRNNLRDVNAEFPLGVMTAVTGVSGSGKSTLVRDVLYPAVVKHLESAESARDANGIGGDINRIKAVEFVNQNPIGKSTRSNAATYLKVYDEIRPIFAEQPLAKRFGFNAGIFSFNNEGGRCEKCKGEGVVNIEMQFMADITLPCDACHGKRFKPEVLEVKYRDKSIADVLEMTVDQAIEFFSADPRAAKVVKRLQPLHDVGLGYIGLGQSSSSLSGGENQRVKLAYFLAKESDTPTLFIFDEPTTGLHFHDISTLLDSFNRLLARGHSIIVIEHNLEVIKSADHIIDLGPEGGDGGGKIVATGTPEQVAKNPKSLTGQFLKPLLTNS